MIKSPTVLFSHGAGSCAVNGRTERSIMLADCFRRRGGFLPGARVPLVILAGLTLSLSLHAQQRKYQQDAIDRGSALYAAHCARCHASGDGVPGVNLKTGQFPHANSDDALLLVIKKGVPGTAMPAHPNLSSYDILSLVAFIRSMRGYGAEPVRLGDPQKGKALFESSGCLNCHRVNGKGSYVALDLNDVGALHPPAFIERALLDPAAAEAEIPGSHFVRAVTKQGKVIVGRRLNADTFTIQLMDEQQSLVSLEKDNLRSLTVVRGPAMPSLKGKFTANQIADLVAYLASLNPPLPLPYGLATFPALQRALEHARRGGNQ